MYIAISGTPSASASLITNTSGCQNAAVCHIRRRNGRSSSVASRIRTRQRQAAQRQTAIHLVPSAHPTAERDTATEQPCGGERGRDAEQQQRTSRPQFVYGPPARARFALQIAVGVHRDGVTDEFEQRQVVDRIGVRVGLFKIDVVFLRELLDRDGFGRSVQHALRDRAARVAAVAIPQPPSRARRSCRGCSR